MNYEEHLILGRQHYDRGNFDAAIKCFNDAITVSPENAMGYFYLGSAYHKLGMFDQALKCYEDFAKFESNDNVEA